ncbi:MAG: DinB family protein [Acidobacteria bacterium]|nr:DinB family protein [Acidobacteriota bacterium]
METAQARPTLGQVMAMEMEMEAATARKMLERLPEDKFEWQPHEKSMTLGRLSGHVAETFEWTAATILQDELDFSKMDYNAEPATSTAGLLEKFDAGIKAALEILNGVSDEDIMKPWTMRDGEKVYMTMPKVAVMRGFVISHMIHHRGQLSVYMRLLDVPVPSIYGPSADEPNM